MATQKADVGSDFASIIARANEMPAQQQHGRDLPDSFPFSPHAEHKVVDTTDEDPKAVPGAVKYPFKIHRRVFTIYRPWESCGRCKDDIGAQKTVLPDVGDYECPHNNKSEYENVQNEILQARLVQGSEQEVVLRDGTIVISLRWYERLATKKDRRAMMKARALAGRSSDEPPV